MKTFARSPQQVAELLARKSKATAFRLRLEMLMEQMAQDRTSPFGPYVPMLCGAMSSMGDEELLELRKFLQAVVGED